MLFGGHPSSSGDAVWPWGQGDYHLFSVTCLAVVRFVEFQLRYESPDSVCLGSPPLSSFRPTEARWVLVGLTVRGGSSLHLGRVPLPPRGERATRAE